jgi:hypothetical protein
VLADCSVLVYCLIYSLTLKMEALCSSKTALNFGSLHSVPVGSIHHSHCHESVTSNISLIYVLIPNVIIHRYLNVQKMDTDHSAHTYVKLICKVVYKMAL